MYTTPGFTDEKDSPVHGGGTHPGEDAREADEFIEVETMPLSRALSLVERGRDSGREDGSGALYVAGFRRGASRLSHSDVSRVARTDRRSVLTKCRRKWTDLTQAAMDGAVSLTTC